jgi:hypothetical protein
VAGKIFRPNENPIEEPGCQNMDKEKKRLEAYVLAVARTAGVPIPHGETPDEEPDFRFNKQSPTLGIELTEVVRPASSNHGILPVEEEAFHKNIISEAERAYYDSVDAKPAHASVTFANAKGKKRDKKEMARILAKFVKANVYRASPFVALNRPETPDGFDSIVISAERIAWWCGEGGGYTVDDIRRQLVARIHEKDQLVPTYRANLLAGGRVWLLLHSGVTVARSMMIPYGIATWEFSFRFDRVFWFAALEGQFAELQRSCSAI